MSLLIIRYCFLFFGMLFQQTAPVTQQVSDHFKITYDNVLPAYLVKLVQDSLEAKFTLYRKALNITVSQKITVRLVAGEDRFNAEAKSPIFDDGIYSEGKIVLDGALADSGGSQFDYVISRVVVSAMTSQVGGCPRWFGLAYGLFVGNEVHRFDGFATTPMFDFSDLDEEFNRASSPRELKGVYSALGKTMQFLVAQYGERRVRSVFSQFKKGISIEEAFEQVFGSPIEDIQQAWRRSLETKQK